MNLLKAKEVADKLNMDVQTVYRLSWKGELKRIRVGGGYRWPEEKLDEYLERQQNLPVKTA